MPYYFMSYGSLHSGKNIGCCIIEVEESEDPNEKSKILGLMPNECNQAIAYLLDEQGFKEQGMELNRFYSREEMLSAGFQKV